MVVNGFSVPVFSGDDGGELSLCRGRTSAVGFCRVGRPIRLSKCIAMVMRMGQMSDDAAGKQVYVTFPVYILSATREYKVKTRA
jgi:hypothetical protein